MVFACYFAKGVSFAVKKKKNIEKKGFHPSSVIILCYMLYN